MVCAECGQKQVEGVNFCQACGAHVPSPAPDQMHGQQPWMPLTSQLPSQRGVPPPYGGVPQGWVPAMQMQRQRVRQNLQPLGITWCLWGVYRLVLGAIAGFWFHAVSHHHAWFWDSGDNFPGFLTAFLPLLALTAVVMASLALLTGWALLTTKPWARTLAIIMAILSLIRIPLGTALGIYTLWVLAPRISGMEYESLVRGTPPRYGANNGTPGD